MVFEMERECLRHLDEINAQENARVDWSAQIQPSIGSSAEKHDINL